MKDLSKVFTEILTEYFIITQNNTQEIWDNSVLMPVPLEKRKLKSRGYNQAEELANALSQILKVPVLSRNLIKIKKTAPQIKLTAIQREENLQDAFSIKSPSEFAGKKVFLVDDVYTTGSTMEACATALKEAGAKQVWGIAIAREG